MIKFGTGGWREIIADGFSRGAAEVLTGYGFRPYFINRSSPTPRPHHLPGQGLHRRLEGILGHLKYKKRTRHCEGRRPAPQGGFSSPSGNSPSGNPLDLPAAQLVRPSIHGIATPVCALVRNDVLIFSRSSI